MKQKHGRGGVGANLNVRVNLAAWYRYRIGVTSINGKCSSWADQSSNTRPLLQATASSRPTVQSDGSLLFDGSASTMQASFTLSQPFTLYMAFKQVTWVLNAIVFDGSTGTTKLTQVTATPALALNGGSALSNDSTLGTNANGVIACIFNGTSSRYQAAGGAASVSTTGDAGSNNAGGITLGASRSGANFSNIAVYEVLAYSAAHDAPTRLQILRYLSRIASVGGVT